MKSLQSKVDKRSTLNLSLSVSEGLDPSNPSEETLVDLKVFEDTKLEDIHLSLIKIMQLPEETKLMYFNDFSKSEMDITKTFKELGIENEGKIYLETVNRKRKRQNYRTGKLNNETGELLQLACTTRIFDSDNIPIRRVRVIVNSNNRCKKLMEDVSSLWGGRTGLKFKCGRTVLNGDRTFDDMGVENNSEIVVTGGRG